MNRPFEEPPPHLPDAERAVLGSMIIDPNLSPMIRRMISSPDSFYEARHKMLYESVCDCLDNHGYVDTTLLRATIEGRGKGRDKRSVLERVGGIEYIAALFDLMPRNPTKMAEIVEQLARVREVQRVSYRIALDAQDTSFDGADEFVQRANKVFSAATTVSGTGLNFVSIGEVLEEVEERYNSICSGEEQTAYIPFGIPTLDDMVKGVAVGDISVIGGDAGNGKTAMCIHLMESAGTRHGGCHVFVREDRPRNWVARVISQYAQVESSPLTRGPAAFYNVAQEARIKQAITRLKASGGITFDNLGSSEISHIIPQLYCLKNERPKCRTVIIDYVQLLRSKEERKRGSGRNYELEDIVQRLKAAGQDLNLAIVLVSQLNREKNKRAGGEPRLDDLRDASALVSDSRFVMMLWAPSNYGVKELKFRPGPGKDATKYYVNDDGMVGGGRHEIRRVMAKVVKNNHGATGDIPLEFECRYTRFRAPNWQNG